jgi:hypothetical protein
LPRDELEGHARTHHPHGPVVSAVVEPVMWDTERAEAPAVRVAGLPPIDPAEEPLSE